MMRFFPQPNLTVRQKQALAATVLVTGSTICLKMLNIISLDDNVALLICTISMASMLTLRIARDADEENPHQVNHTWVMPA